MKPLKTILLAALLGIPAAAGAETPFRTHRYSGFDVLPVTERNIVFIGNSITNMHEWWEAFDNPLVLNRGVSAAVSDELLAHLDPIVKGRPAKVFLMIGTNDLGTRGIDNAAHVAQNVRRAVARFRNESPRTEVYVQSILPSRRRNLALQRETNDSLRAICREAGATYIDLWDDLLSVSEDNQHTLDGLHLSASGYRIWCSRIAPLVGSPCAYPRNFADYASGLDRSNGMRATQFAALPVRTGDVLMIGDELVHSGEWHELLGSERVRSRSIGWGYPGIGIGGISGCLDAIFHGRPDNGTPAKAFFYVGAADQCGGRTAEQMLTDYEAMLAKAHALSPATQLVVGTLLPVADAAVNERVVIPFNDGLRRLAARNKHIAVADFYTAMQRDGHPDAEVLPDEYVNGKGYLRLAALLRPLLLGK